MNLHNDPKLELLVSKEEERQAGTLDLIASENIVSEDIRKLVGSALLNKYSEGYPGKRYYPGNEHIDEIERLAAERALNTFSLSDEWRVNVQPYSGSPANTAVYVALLDFGETLLGMDLASGGHLTHGHKVNFSGRAYNAVSYGVNAKTGLIDYREVERLARRFCPKVVVSGLTAYPRLINFKRFGEIAKRVGAYHLADISHIAGLVASGAHPSPFPYADVVTTTTHKTLRGPRGAVIFARKEIAEKIDKAVFPGLQGGPHDNVTAAIAYTFGQAASPRFRRYARRVVENAKTLADFLKKRGFMLVTGGTDNHLMLLDLRRQKLDGLKAEKMLEAAGIIANRNSIPGDKTPFRPSGIRIGTPAMTSRGLTPQDMPRVADWIFRILIKKEPPKRIHSEIRQFLLKFPV